MSWLQKAGVWVASFCILGSVQQNELWSDESLMRSFGVAVLLIALPYKRKRDEQ